MTIVMSDRLACSRRFLWLRWCWLLVLLIAVQIATSTARAGCSPEVRKFVINELNLINTNTDDDTDTSNDTARPFVELKVLDQEIIDQMALDTWAFPPGWKVTSIKSNGTKYVKDLTAIYSGAATSNANNLCQDTTSVYIRIPFENDELQDTGNVILSDPDGAIVDILRVSKDSTISTYYGFTDNAGPYPTASNQYPNPSCNTCDAGTCSGTNQLPYDSDFNNFGSGGQASKDIQRLPDGTGPWKEAPGGGNNTQQTLCTTNDNVLRVTKTPSAYSVPLNSNVTYTLTIKGSANYATGSANTNVTVTELMPSGLAYSSHAVASGNGSATYSGGTVTWTIPSLAAGVTASMTVTATVTGDGAITNTATATSDELGDANTQASATINALLVAVSTDKSAVAVGDNVVYTVTITNRSSANVTSVAASLPLPAGLDLISAGTPTAGTFNGSSWTNIGTLAPNNSVTLTFTAQTTQTGTIVYPVSATTSLYPGNFTGSASILVGPTGSFQISVPDFKAGDGTVTPATITAQDSLGAPQPGFANAVRKVKFYYQPVNPASGASGAMKMDAYEAASNTTVSVGAVATSLAAAVTRDVYFDAGGIGRFDLNYDNVGEFRLFAEWQPTTAYENPPPSGTPVLMSGNDNFIVAPYRYDIVPMVSAVPISSAAGGSAFDVTVTAQALCGKVNWGYACPGASIYTTATDFAGSAASAVTLKVDAAGLNNTPALWCTSATATCPNDETTAPSVANTDFSAGIATLLNLHWSEAGPAVLTAEAAYLGSATLSNTGNTIASYPSRFGASGSVTSDAGATFLYYGQPGLDFAQTIAAEVPRPDLTYRTAQNYAAGVYGGVLATVVSQSTVGATALNACTDTTCVASVTNGASSCTWAAGICQVLASDASFPRAAAPAVPQTVAFSVQITDTENKVASCVKSSTPTNCTGAPNVFSADYGSIELRYGRIRLQNAFGSEKLPLAVPMIAEFWTANGWVTNTLDNTTQWLTAVSNAGALANTYSPAPYASNTDAQACYGNCLNETSANPAVTATQWADVGGTLLIDNITSANSASPILATSSAPVFPARAPDSTTLAGGMLALAMSAPGTRTGSFDLTMVVPPWLQLNGAYPRAKVAFGIYGGSNRFIYRREVR